MREPDATIVQPDDPEIEADEAQDEFAGGSLVPADRQLVALAALQRRFVVSRPCSCGPLQALATQGQAALG